MSERKEAEEVLHGLGLTFETIDVGGDVALAGLYGDAIPVLLNDDREVARAPLTRGALRKALKSLGLEVAG